MISTRLGLVGAVSALALLASGCGTDTQNAANAEEKSGEEVTVTAANGEVTVPTEPDSVVVLDIAALDAIDALGKGDSITGLVDGSTPEYLADYQNGDIPSVGGLKEPDLDAISEIAPDVIIAGGRSAEMADELNKIAPTVVYTVDATAEDTVAASAEQVDMLGQIFGDEEAATTVDADVKTAVDGAQDAGADAGSTLMLSTGGGKISAFGPGSRFGVVFTEFGFTPATDDIEQSPHGETVSFEYVAEADPETIFVVDTDAAKGKSEEQPAAEVMDNELVAGTKAAKNDQIIYLDPVTWYILGISGPQALQSMAEEVQADA